jgi:phosphotriesterase-related protein
MFEVFIPLLLEVGFTQAKIDMLLKENPERILLGRQYD